MAEESGQDSTSKQDALIVTGDDWKATENEETEDTSSQSEETDSPSSEEEAPEPNEFDELIGLMLELDPAQYAQPWEPIEILKMREILTAGKGKFPKKALPYIHLMRKFCFANGQLVAMAALAHQSACRKRDRDEQLVKPATFKELGQIEAAKARGE
jgi:hypothetical protein